MISSQGKPQNTGKVQGKLPVYPGERAVCLHNRQGQRGAASLHRGKKRIVCKIFLRYKTNIRGFRSSAVFRRSLDGIDCINGEHFGIRPFVTHQLQFLQAGIRFP